MTDRDEPLEAVLRADDDPEIHSLDEATRLEELRLSLRVTFDTRKMAALKARRGDLFATRNHPNA
jgi:hypothetical protein